jgi:hypothetical protein
MRNIGTVVRGHYDDNRYMWDIIIRRFCDKRANGMVLQGLKPRIFDKLNKHDKKWAAELPSVLWSLRMTPSRATGFTPFFLVYGSEAMLPTDVEYGSLRLKAYNEKNNDATREDVLDQLEEGRDVTLLHSARYQQSL